MADAILQYRVKGTLEIHLDGFKFGGQRQLPSFHPGGQHQVDEQHLLLKSHNLDGYTGWGAVNIHDINFDNGYIEFIVNTHDWGQARAEFFFDYPNGSRGSLGYLESGIRGPVGDPERKMKIYQTQIGI